MEEWKEYKFAEIATIISGGTPKTSIPRYWNGNIPWLSVKDFGNDNKYVFSTEKTISKEGFNNSSTNMLYKNDIIISARGTVGELAMISCPMSFNQSCFGLRSKGLVDKDFLYYLMKTKVKELKNNSHGSVFDTITRTTFDNIICRIPNAQEQRKIATILSSLDDKIELNRRINDNLEQQAQMMFDQHLMNNTATEFCKLSDIANINPKRTVSKNTKARYIEMSNLPTKGSFPCGWEYKEFSGGMKFMNGDTLMARITPCLENGKVAFINFLNNGEIAFGSTEYIVISSKGIYSSEWFYFLTRNKTFVDYSIKHMNGSSGRQRVSGESIGDFPLPQFSKDSLKPIFLMAESALKIIKRNSLENIKLSAIRDSLLPRLMSGELKINETNN